MIKTKQIFKRASLWAWPVLLFASLSACNFQEMLQPGAWKGRQGANEGAPEPANVKIMSPREKFGFYRWLVVEMQEQIFARQVKDKNDAGGWANVLSQRGSIEGVYHGFVLSTDYIGLEQAKKAADIKALRFFGLEMALMDFSYLSETDEKVQGTAAKYVQDNLGTSIFTLKKDLGERIIKETVKRKGDDEKLAAWYSGIAARWAKLDIPFGLPERNTKDEVFHFNWAKDNTLGMLQWELLNREHRILNQFGGIAVPVPPPAPARAVVNTPPNPNAPLPKSANPAGM